MGTTPKISLIGLPTDVHSSFVRGAGEGPSAIRRALSSDHSNSATEWGPEFGSDLILEDAGDLPLTEGADDPELISTATESAARSGAVPICIGGDHMISFPAVRGIARVHGPLNILHFDAHTDLYDDFCGDPLSHASPFARIMESGLAQRLVQVGIRTLNRHCRAQAQRFKVEIVEMRNFMIESVPIPPEPLYVSIDLDALDPAFAPGVSHHEPGGLSTRELLSVLHRINIPIVGADVVELNPSRDIGDLTATLAAKLVKELSSLSSRSELNAA